MDHISKLKLSIYESHDAGLIDDDTLKKMVSVCESAYIENEEDREKLSQIVDTLIGVNESTGNEPVDTKKIADSIKLEIYESERSGEVSEEEKDLLLEMLEDM